ncbi:hypothetical protein At1D132_49140 (plasmid) [Agrobacterium fabrum]|nr:hypothetical protein At1D132_49140 [Agrobacterium fabrum]
MTLIAQIRLIAAAQQFNDPDLEGASTPITSHQDIEGFFGFCTTALGAARGFHRNANGDTA